MYAVWSPGGYCRLPAGGRRSKDHYDNRGRILRRRRISPIVPLQGHARTDRILFCGPKKSCCPLPIRLACEGTDDESANHIDHRPFRYSGFQFHSADCHWVPCAAARRAPDFVPNTVDRSPLGRPPPGRNTLSEGEKKVVGGSCQWAVGSRDARGYL